MGAKHLDDVLWRVVPSFYSFNQFGDRIIYARGTEKPRILIMINGLPSYDLLNQAIIYLNYDVLNVDNVKRIEFVRGPGSALYGANAYDGVINIITKKAEDVDGVELTAR